MGMWESRVQQGVCDGIWASGGGRACELSESVRSFPAGPMADWQAEILKRIIGSTQSSFSPHLAVSLRSCGVDCLGIPWPSQNVDGVWIIQIPHMPLATRCSSLRAEKARRGGDDEVRSVQLRGAHKDKGHSMDQPRPSKKRPARPRRGCRKELHGTGRESVGFTDQLPGAK
eukprot:s656_g33.t1